ncbi:MAG: 50S ribosomal protein L9 [Clostridiales bacterium]|jgi:large subunit ribosomal protein L9|nr:50S ribosomal protein L9 [Clostridiales bacterium]
MKVILLEDVKGVGTKGQLINAADGHARNFLLPRKLAMEASGKVLAELENKKKAAEQKVRRELEEADKARDSLNKATVRVTAKMGENGKLFGAVTSKEISAALEEQLGIVLDRKKIVLDEPIKTAGESKVHVKLQGNVTADLTVEVVRQ